MPEQFITTLATECADTDMEAPKRVSLSQHFRAASLSQICITAIESSG